VDQLADAVDPADQLAAVAVVRADWPAVVVVVVDRAGQRDEASAVDPADQVAGPADRSAGRAVQLEDQVDQSDEALAVDPEGRIAGLS
jgi:hypothetical protein